MEYSVKERRLISFDMSGHAYVNSRPKNEEMKWSRGEGRYLILGAYLTWKYGHVDFEDMPYTMYFVNFLFQKK